MINNRIKIILFNGLFNRLLTVIMTGCALLMYSCRHDMDTTNLPEVKFSTTVQGILSANCNFSGCHGDSGGGGHEEESFSLVGYDNVIENGKVKAGDAHSSDLYKVISGHGKKMPPDPRSPLADDDIKRIYVWIEQGAKNN
jgi:hypothetical protein